jgi:hypothetical protein
VVARLIQMYGKLDAASLLKAGKLHGMSGFTAKDDQR